MGENTKHKEMIKGKLKTSLENILYNSVQKI